MITERDVERIAQDLGKETRSGKGYSCLCPTHDDHTPSLHLSEDNGKLLYKCFSGCDQEIVGKALRQKFPEFLKHTPALNSRVVSGRKQMSKEEMANSLWMESVAAKDTPVETYIQQRVPNTEADHIPSCLKYLPQAYHSQTRKKLRCLIAPFTNYPSHDVQSVSRTYLNEKGTDKADVNPQKMILGAVKGGAIVLDQPKECLGIAEGLESALSVREIVKRQIPVWATGTATNLANVKLPTLPLASEVIVFCDYDNAGLKAALDLSARAKKEGRNVKILRPLHPHTDWNDLYQDAVKNKSDINLESLGETVNEEEELKRLDLTQQKLGKESSAKADNEAILEGIDDDVAIAKHLFRQLQKQYGEVVYAEGNLWAYPANSTHWRSFHDEYLIRRIQSYSGKGNIKLDGKFEYIELSKSKIGSILSNLYSLKKIRDI